MKTIPESLKFFLKTPIETLFLLFEKQFLLKGECRPQSPPIFILGLPRSGSTLLLQLMIRYFSLCYFTNFSDRFATTPIMAAKISSLFNGCDPDGKYASFYGRTKGWKGPYDGSKIWSRWFPSDPIYVPEGTLSSKDLISIGRTITHFENTFKSPFINKAQRNNGRILELNRIFPDSIFLIITRDHTEIIKSIYNGFDQLNKKNLWFSMKPSNWQNITTTDLIDHICEEVFYTEKDIERDASKIGNHRFFFLDYATLCDHPKQILDGFAKFYKQQTKGICLKIRHEIPNRLKKSTGVHCTKEHIKKIQVKMETLLNDK